MLPASRRVSSRQSLQQQFRLSAGLMDAERWPTEVLADFPYLDSPSSILKTIYTAKHDTG